MPEARSLRIVFKPREHTKFTDILEQRSGFSLICIGADYKGIESCIGKKGCTLRNQIYEGKMQEVFIQQYGSNDFQSIIKPNSILFFDMDGTLIETTGLNNYAYSQAFQKVMGYPIPSLKTDRITRKSLRDLPNISTSEIDEIVSEKGQIYSERISLATPIPSTIEILNNYSSSHNTYLVTRSQLDRALDTISHFGLLDRFTGIISSNAENKYQDAITELGVNPNDIIALENEDKEIEAGIKAGISRSNIIKVTYGIFYNSTK